MWITVGSNKGRKIVLFNYSRTRKEEVVLSLLEGFNGVLQTDGYAGYNKAVSEYGLYHASCLAHARRKFFEASKVSKGTGIADEALRFIRELYRIKKN